MDITAVSNMDFSTSILCFFSTWACLLVFTRIRRRVFPCKFPPGPFPLPIFGNLFELGNKPHESLAELAATYGPLMTLKLGSVTAIVVSSANMAKEVLQKHDQTFSGRTIPHAVQALNHHEVSMTWLPSSLQWRTFRKICATQIFTAQRLNDNEGIRLTKVKDLIDHIREESKSKHTINIGQTVFSTILNMISNTLFSIDLAPYQSKSGGEFKAIVWGVLEEVGKPNFADYFPLLRSFDPQGIKRRMSVYFRKLDKLFDTIIDQRLQFKKQDASRDLLDILLHHTEENGFKLGPLDIRALLKTYKSAKVLKGDGVSTGSVKFWKYVLPGETGDGWAVARKIREGNSEVFTCTEKIEEIDDEKMLLVLNVYEGNVRSYYKLFIVKVQVIPGEERNMVKWTVEYEKENEDMPDPHDYMDLYSVENDKLDAYLVSKRLN
ncbi:hypothetical protein IFM89_005836 [Coptis chinensis]|uniref:Bet v I/Major latex protein domain-containing protein n=1 Tax=Coptis chinensis TaxID=261450 RepID=A0A835GXR5_9MAGN|nr:hypothetical protein IFM89_005836 [Coptis chinensis]